jgi:hypothetical protein
MMASDSIDAVPAALAIALRRRILDQRLASAAA